MDVQSIVLGQLIKCNHKINTYQSKKITKNVAQANIVRLSDIQGMINTIKNTNFINYIPDYIQPLISPYGTFYDRYTFYYDPLKLQGYNNVQISQIILCEFFNTQQGYFTSKKMNSATPGRIQGISILMMYHIGLVEEKIWYGQMIRNDLMRLIKESYPDNDIISFSPNQNACAYLYNKMINNDPLNKLAHHMEKLITANITQMDIIPISWFPTQMRGLNTPCTNKTYQIYFEVKPNGNLKQLSPTSKKVKEHKEVIELTEKLAGGI